MLVVGGAVHESSLTNSIRSLDSQIPKLHRLLRKPFVRWSRFHLTFCSTSGSHIPSYKTSPVNQEVEKFRNIFTAVLLIHVCSSQLSKTQPCSLIAENLSHPVAIWWSSLAADWLLEVERLPSPIVHRRCGVRRTGFRVFYRWEGCTVACNAILLAWNVRVIMAKLLACGLTFSLVFLYSLTGRRHYGLKKKCAIPCRSARTKE